MHIEYDEERLFSLERELNSDEERRIELFTGEFSEEKYNGEFINRALRDNNINETVQKSIDVLDEIISLSRISVDYVMHRVIYTEDFKLPLSKSLISDKGYMEASLLSAEDIQNTLPGRDIILEILVPANSICLFTTPYNNREYEKGVLFPRNTWLYVNRIKKGIFSKKITIYCRICNDAKE